MSLKSRNPCSFLIGYRVYQPLSQWLVCCPLVLAIPRVSIDGFRLCSTTALCVVRNSYLSTRFCRHPTWKDQESPALALGSTRQQPFGPTHGSCSGTVENVGHICGKGCNDWTKLQNFMGICWICTKSWRCRLLTSIIVITSYLIHFDSHHQIITLHSFTSLSE